MIKYLRWTPFRRSLAAAMALTTVGTGMVTLAATPSTAADAVTNDQVINDCLKDERVSCTWRISYVSPAYLGNAEMVSVNSDFYYNCTQRDESLRPLDFSQMTGTENSTGVEVGAETPGGFLGGLLQGIKLRTNATYQETKGTYPVTVKKGEVAWLERAQVMKNVVTTYTITYPEPINGQRTYTADDTWSVPVADGMDAESQLVGRTRPMNAWELQSMCGWDVPLPPSPASPPTPQIRASPKAFGVRTLPPGWWTEGTLTRLVMQYDGNLVMYRKRDGAAIWSTGTHGHDGAYAVMQTDGNLVVYTASGKYPVYPWGVRPYETPTRALWSSHTYGNADAWAMMQNDGNFVIYNSTGGPSKGGALWSTGTNTKAR
ncbi:hypothetical protein [Streptomyces sp. NPDC048191]|uniref:hypothetical protein n=1 Tax=Streptomyces sp. NPDC048191 TaxID=3155484 RepID=UPI0033D35116